MVGGTSSRRNLSLVVKLVKNELSSGSLSRLRTTSFDCV
jgi:hypothetical protein